MSVELGQRQEGGKPVKELHLNAYAKVNLALDVGPERPDGYHEIESVMHTISLHDSITLREAGAGTEVIVNDGANVPTDHRNLVARTAELLREMFAVTRPVQIELTKRIPVAAGLGGGSSDAAVTLLGLVQMWKLRLDGRELLGLATKLGADVPFFLEGGGAIARGKGERLTFLPPLPTTWMVLARPQVEVSTAWAYRQLPAEIPRRPDIGALIEAIKREDVREIGRLMHNVFEEVISQTHPVIEALRSRILRGESYGASMSGTGPTVFGLMANEAAARKVAEDLRAIPDVDVYISRTFAENR